MFCSPLDNASLSDLAIPLIREASCVLELPVIGAGCLARHLDTDGECACRDIIRAIALRDALVCEDVRTVGLVDLVQASVCAAMPL